MSVGGRYRFDYEGEAVNVLKLISNYFIIPMYSGVSFKAKLFFISRFIISLPVILFSSVYLANKLKNYDFIFLTSSIQIPLILLFKFARPDVKVVIFIQENFIFSNSLWSLFCKRYLLKASLVISITKEWKEYALKNGICSHLLENHFLPLDKVYVANEKKYDVLYVGGDLKLKGFFEVLNFAKEASKEMSFSIAMIGEYSLDSQALIQSVNNEIEKFGTKIFYIGFVDDIYPYLVASKILLLPIQAPHFCRPAIEAGVCKVPFLISDFKGELDFAIDQFNSFRYSPKNVGSLIACFKEMISGERYLRYGENNYHYYIKNYKKNKFSSTLIGYVRELT